MTCGQNCFQKSLHPSLYPHFLKWHKIFWIFVSRKIWSYLGPRMPKMVLQIKSYWRNQICWTLHRVSQRALINWWVCIHNKHRKTTPFLITARSSTPCCVCQYIRCPTPRCITQRKTILAILAHVGLIQKRIQRISWHRFCQHDGKTGRTLDRWQQFHIVFRFRTKIPSRVLVKFCTEKRGLSWIFYNI